MLHTDVHAATYALDPEYHGHIKSFEKGGEILQGL